MEGKDNNKAGRYKATVQLSEELSERIRKYLSSPEALVRNRDDLIEHSLQDFLSREELIIKEIKAVAERIRGRTRY